MLAGQVTRMHVATTGGVMLGIVGAMLAHCIEIGVFAAGMAVLHQLPASWHVGDLVGAQTARSRTTCTAPR